MTKKAVVVGAGNISRAWLPILRDEDVQIVGLVDLDRKRAKAQSERYDINPFILTDVKEALRKLRPDFVVDLTVPDAHCSVTCTALRMGCHVIGEKPMAATMAQARRMVRVSEETGKLYMVSQSRRYNPEHAGLTRFLAEKRLGRLTTVHCTFSMGAHFGGFRDRMAHPLILDMAIHHFDLARMFTGADPVAVYAKSFNPHGSWYAGDAAAACIFEMSNGLIFTYAGSWCAEGMHTSWHGDWRLAGEKGSIVYSDGQTPSGEVITGNEGFHRPTAPVKVEVAETAEGQQGALREFLRALDGGPLPQGECHDNIKSLAMVFAAIESAKRGRRVPVRG